MKSFGTDFVLINDTIQRLDKHIPLPGGPYIHLATIMRGLDEYIIYRQASSYKAYMEKVGRNQAEIILEQIDDDLEWAELYKFAESAGIFRLDRDEIKVA